MKKTKIYIANDHTGEIMKKALVEHLNNQGFEVIDLSTNQKTEAWSYSVEGLKLGQAVAKDPQSLGIAICGTGVGISIAANKVKGIRAGLVYELETAQLIREHNNANILATGARLIAVEKAIKLVDAFLAGVFADGRHAERVKTIDEYLG